MVATDLESGRQQIIYPDDAGSACDQVQGEIFDAAKTAARKDRSSVVECAGQPIFFNVFNPRLRLVIVGGVHIAQPLSVIAKTAGYEVAVIDPRTAFANRQRFPRATLLTEWPDDALRGAALDSHTAVVTLTHDPKLDDAALGVALTSDVFYVGCLGSKKTHGARLDRLRRQGLAEPVLGRIHGPVGLDIGANSPAEIAIAIMAEITETLRRGSDI